MVVNDFHIMQPWLDLLRQAAGAERHFKHGRRVYVFSASAISLKSFLAAARPANVHQQSVTIPVEPDLAEIQSLQVLRADEEIGDAYIAPHDFEVLVGVAIDLQE